MATARRRAHRVGEQPTLTQGDAEHLEEGRVDATKLRIEILAAGHMQAARVPLPTASRRPADWCRRSAW